MELEKLVKELVATEEVVVLEVRGDGINSPLKVIVDAEIPISIDLVTRITKLIRDSAEMETVFPDGFQLEVSSPGIEAPLQFPFQYRKNIERKLKVAFFEQQVEKEITGKLTRVDDDGIFLNSRTKQNLFIAFERILRAKTIISFKG